MTPSMRAQDAMLRFNDCSGNTVFTTDVAGYTLNLMTQDTTGTGALTYTIPQASITSSYTTAMNQLTVQFDAMSVQMQNSVAKWDQAVQKLTQNSQRKSKYNKAKQVPPSALNPNKQVVTPPANFNRYINASDCVEDFIRYAGEHGARQDDVLQLPIELFIKWLIIQACEQDDEEPNVSLELPPPVPQPRCLGCQRYMHKNTTMPMHGRACALRYFARVERAAVPRGGEDGRTRTRGRRPRTARRVEHGAGARVGARNRT